MTKDEREKWHIVVNENRARRKIERLAAQNQRFDLWLSERCVIDDFARVTSKQCLANYRDWCNKSNLPTMGVMEWSKIMPLRFDKIHCNGVVFYRGLKLRDIDQRQTAV